MRSRLPAKLPMRPSTRCHAGTPRQSAAMANWHCRMCGGKAPDAAKGNSNALKYGGYTAVAIAERGELMALLSGMKGALEQANGKELAVGIFSRCGRAG
ncbi:hypothetical protein NVS89_14535 [Ancylobacter sp. MQZ15Z-1]|uniref:Uncharacterized protein n=1 Tax=Ancylobacter mangrovi TaxID=2972472 RepID=A0A9X2PCP6_9HYPH|nr:hypothetical protein [Ancylobacter mangrovi]MCS0496319.1 hypothetical protein [Ancylobacter mangrovi]